MQYLLGDDVGPGDAKVSIIFSGSGVHRRIEAIMPYREGEANCFPARTDVLLARTRVVEGCRFQQGSHGLALVA